jgi:sarcosine oxidase
LPQHLIRDGDVAFFDPEGGYVRSERAVMSAVRLAQRNGASFLGNRTVAALERDGDRWSVRTDQEEVRAPRVLICTGTGAGPVCAALGTHLAVLPQVLTWCPIADPEAYRAQEQQVFIRRSRDAQFYGFPSSDGWTVKVAASVYLDEAASMTRPLSWDPRHLDTIRSWVATFLPDLIPEPVRAVLCADGYTVDETGLLGVVPGMDGVVVAVGFSGHGFKMTSSLGAVAADLIADGTTATDVAFMDPARFIAPAQTVASLPVTGAAPSPKPS